LKNQLINEKPKSAQLHPGITIFENNLSEQQKLLTETDEVLSPQIPTGP
jgi:hypothetical protein